MAGERERGRERERAGEREGGRERERRSVRSVVSFFPLLRIVEKSHSLPLLLALSTPCSLFSVKKKTLNTTFVPRAASNEIDEAADGRSGGTGAG